MFKKISIVPIVFLSVIMFSDLSLSAVEGTWDVTGTVKAKASIRGVGSGSETVATVDEFIFLTDGTFQMLDMDGIWTQTKNKVTVYLDPIDVATYLETGLEDMLLTLYGYNVDVSVLAVTKNSFSAKESKDGNTLKSKYKLSIGFSIYFYNFGMEYTGKASATASFIGTRNPGLLLFEESESSEGIDPFLYGIAETIIKSILTRNPVSSQ